MATLYIEEFTGEQIQAAGIGIPVPFGKTADQTVTFTTATTSTAFNSSTKVIRLIADANFHLEDDGTAATASQPLYIANTEYWLSLIHI